MWASRMTCKKSMGDPCKIVKCFLVVGLGSIGRRHARLVRDLYPEAKIVVLRHQTCQDSTDGIFDHCVTDVSRALQYEPDAAIVCSPASTHIAIAKKLADFGVHLLIEKPVSDRSEGV